MWGKARRLLQQATNALERQLTKTLPHLHSLSSCYCISRLAEALFTAREVFNVEDGLEDEVQMRIGTMLHGAGYALACALGDFGRLLQVLRHNRGDIGRLSGIWTVGFLPFSHSGTADTTYVWCRLHLGYITRMQTGVPGEACLGESDTQRTGGKCQLLSKWLQMLHLSLRDAALRLEPSTYPVDPIQTLAMNESARTALAAIWAALASGRNPASAVVDNVLHEESGSSPMPTSIWPLEEEHLRVARDPCDHRTSPSVEIPAVVFHSKGDCVRALCVNALNPCQIAVSLNRRIHQLALFQPTSASSCDVSLSKVQESNTAGFTARCLCAHPKVGEELPVYLLVLK